MEEHAYSEPRVDDVRDGPAQPGPGAAAPPPSPPPARSIRPRTLAVVAVVAAGLAAAVWVGTRVGAHAAHGSEGATVAEASGGKDAGPRYYTCGMHPWVVLPHPGPCPICGMPLVPLDPAKFSGEVTIDPVVVQNIGVRVAPVVRGPVVQTIRTVGTVDYDEELVRDVNVKVAGWVQKLHVDQLGQEVRKGEPLFELYSPELYQAQEEYLLALRGGPLGGGASTLRDAARTKLEYDDVSPGEIAALAKRGKATKTITLRSPYSGVVTEKATVEGMRLAPGMRVFRIADLSKVWVMVTLYEYQLPLVRAGQAATMTLPYVPGKALQGQVVYVYPYLDKKARQVNVRLEFDNPGLALKPGMYATVTLDARLGQDRTLAPRAAVIDTGERKVAFVSRGEGRFEPRQVKTGVHAQDGMVEILDGLKPGDQVVTSGEFLLDSEAKVREALAKMIRGNLASAAASAEIAKAAAPAQGAIPDAAQSELSSALARYLHIGGALAKDDLVPVKALASEMASSVQRLGAIEVPGDPQFWHEHDATSLQSAASALAQATTLDQARTRFATVSDAATKLVQATGVPADLGALDQLHCPMYREDQGGAAWLQRPGDVANPYLGKAMLRCSDKRTSLPLTKTALVTPSTPADGRRASQP